jgi:hypothetical protein
MKRISMGLPVALLALGLVAGTGVPADAAPATVAAAKTTPAKYKVAIGHLKGRTAPYNGKVTVKPSVKAAGQVKLTSKTLTVKKSGRTMASRKSSVRLAAGTYKVTTTAKYNTYSLQKVSTKVRSKQLVGDEWESVQANCTVTSVNPHVVEDQMDYFDYKASCTGNFDGTYTVKGRQYNSQLDSWYGEESYSSEEWWSGPVVQPQGGSKFSGEMYPAKPLYKTVTKTKTTTKKVWSKTRTKTRVQTLTVKAGARPTRMTPSGWNCPSWAPVKGNQSGIYHVPGGAFYSRTNPEECFATEWAAVKAGYRRSKR